MKKYIDKTKTIDGEEFDLHDSRLIDAVPEGKFLSDDFTWKTVEMPVVTQVIPNPPLEGDEDNLTGLQVGEVKYKIKDVRLPEPNEEGKILQVGENGYELNDIPEGVDIIELDQDNGYLTDEQFELAKKDSTIIVRNYGTYKNVYHKVSSFDPGSGNSIYYQSHFNVDYNSYTNTIRSDRFELQVSFSSKYYQFKRQDININSIIANIPTIPDPSPVLTSLKVGSNFYKIPSGGAGLTVVELTGYSGTLTTEQKTALEGDNAIIKWNLNSATYYLYKYRHYYPISDGYTIYYVFHYFDTGSNLSPANYICFEYGQNYTTWRGTSSSWTEYKIRAINPVYTDSSPNLTSLDLNGTTYKIASSGETLIETTYSNLKSLRDNSQLIPGCWYRITNYRCYVNYTDITSANHDFDLLVLATSINTLSEEAKAIQHNGDTYFSGCNLNAWKIWYCLDNDRNRFYWAKSSGRGVIYRLIDDYDNDLPYDFKNIQYNFKGVYKYTFDYNGQDASILSSLNGTLPTYNNTVKYNYKYLPIVGFYYTGSGIDYHICNNRIENSTNVVFNNEFSVGPSFENNFIVDCMFLEIYSFQGSNNTFKNSTNIYHKNLNTYNCPIYNMKVFNCYNINISCNLIEKVEFDGNQYLKIEYPDIFQNIKVHPGVQGENSENPLLINIKGDSSYSTDIYAANSKTITLGGN